MITQEYLQTILSYSEGTGIFRWLIDKPGVTKGMGAGSLNLEGRRQIVIDGKPYVAHALAWLYMTGTYPLHPIDHKDTDPDNNKWVNLREATLAQNGYNNRIRKDNTTGIKGITFSRGTWVGRICYEGKRYQKNNIKKQIVVDWLREVREQLHGEYANHG